MPRLKRQPIEPVTRVGHCCGCNLPMNLTLYKIVGIFRYRCDACYEQETGHRHHLSPQREQSRIVLP